MSKNLVFDHANDNYQNSNCRPHGSYQMFRKRLPSIFCVLKTPHAFVARLSSSVTVTGCFSFSFFAFFFFFLVFCRHGINLYAFGWRCKPFLVQATLSFRNFGHDYHSWMFSGIREISGLKQVRVLLFFSWLFPRFLLSCCQIGLSCLCVAVSR